jgi:D-3-phosphoglycerate dehydrogenase
VATGAAEGTHRPWTVVISDHTYGDVSIEAGVLAGLGPAVRLLDPQCHTGPALAAHAAEADAILNQYCPVDASVIASLGRCRVIARYGVGTDTVDLAAATAHGIAVTHVPDYCVDEVSDHALALLLAMARRVVQADAWVHQGHWDLGPARPVARLRGQTLGLLGCGRIAQALARKAQALGLHVRAHDPWVPPAAMQAVGIEAVDLQGLARSADFLSVHVPLTAETRGLVGEALLRLMKPTAVLINTSRGPVVDEEALAAALAAGRLAGAALDVLAHEPPAADHPLRRLPQVLLTPHMAWYSREAEGELRRRAGASVVAVLRGERPDHLANPEVWPRRRGA